MSLIPTQEEGPFDPLTIDPVRYSPDDVSRRFVAITNALMDRYRQAGEYRKALVGNTARKGDDYTSKRGPLYQIEAEIEALQKKYDTLRTLIFMKTTEIRHFMSG